MARSIQGSGSKGAMHAIEGQSRQGAMSILSQGATKRVRPGDNFNLGTTSNYNIKLYQTKA